MLYTCLEATDTGRQSQGDGALTNCLVRQIEDDILTILIEKIKLAA